MLAFSSFSDAHFHIFPSNCNENVLLSLKNMPEFYGCTAAHDQNEFFKQKSLVQEVKSFCPNACIVQSFGMHPQMPLPENAKFMEELLRSGEIQAVGEAGFDFFTPEFKSNADTQKEAWNIQLELAAVYGVPVVIHVRKALDLIFADMKRLKKVNGVLFHSFPGGIAEARSVLAKLPDAFFSFGKQIFNGNKKAVSCVKELPSENLLLETDAPYQFLKGEKFTAMGEIEQVYKAACCLRNTGDGELFCNQLLENFRRLYRV